MSEGKSACFHNLIRIPGFEVVCSCWLLFEFELVYVLDSDRVLLRYWNPVLGLS